MFCFVFFFTKNASSQGLKNYWVITKNRSRIGDKIVETLSSNGVTSKNKTIYTPPHPSIQIWGVCCFPQVTQSNSEVAQYCVQGMGKGKPHFSVWLTSHVVPSPSKCIIRAFYNFDWQGKLSVVDKTNLKQR